MVTLWVRNIALESKESRWISKRSCINFVLWRKIQFMKSWLIIAVVHMTQAVVKLKKCSSCVHNCNDQLWLHIFQIYHHPCITLYLIM